MFSISRSLTAPLASYRNLLVLWFLIAAAAIGCVVLTRRAKAATTWHVSVGNPGACTTGDPNCSTIKGAVSAAASGDTIVVAAGTYNEHDINIDFDLTINGAGANTTIVDAQQQGRVFFTCCGTINISGLTITNGKSSDGVPAATMGGGSHGDDAGGIGNQAVLTITSCTISNNATGKGGDLLFLDSPATSKVGTPTTVTATGGRGGNGGGIWNTIPGQLTIRNSTISNNRTGNGGAGNVNGPAGAGGDGGGIWNNSSLTVINSTVASNQTGAGGPPGGNPAKPTDVNAVGGAGGEGGGIANSGTMTVQASTIALNQTGNGNAGGNGGAGGGVYTGETVATPIFKSDIIANNSVGAGGSGPDIFTDTAVSDQGFNVVGKTDGSTGFTAPSDQTGTIASPLDAKLDPAGLQSNGGPTKTIALQATSPAVDRGINTFSLTTDQRGPGFARTFDNPSIGNGGGDGTDTGAFEIQAPPSPCAIDTTPPTITCPANITKFTDSGQNTATVNPGTPVASDNCALKSVNGVRSDGKPLNAPYPLGVTVITWTATDTSGNTATCGQSIAVSVPGGSRKVLP